MGTFDITLPAGNKIVFPSRCVVCEKPKPDGFVKLSFLGIKTASVLEMAEDKILYDAVDPKYYGSNTSNKIEGIPACTGCASKLKWYHRLLKFGYYTAWIPGIVPILLGFPLIISMPFMLLCAVSPGILTLVFPPSFGASFWDDKANFEFKSALTAKEFLELNADAKPKNAASKIEANTAANEAAKSE